MLWLLFLSCIMGYQEEGNLTTLSIEQTHATHHYNHSKALESSLKIICFNGQFENVGHGSGNYFKVGAEKFVVTAAHLIIEDSALYADDKSVYIRLDLVHVDLENDIAILKPSGNLINTKAVDYRINTKKDILGMSVVHAGYPADLQKSIFNGMVSRCSENAITMQSFALPGSSGSVVFDNSGRVIGLVSALKVAAHGYSPYPQLYETLVYASRLNKYNRSAIKEILRQWKNSE